MGFKAASIRLKGPLLPRRRLALGLAKFAAAIPGGIELMVDVGYGPPERPLVMHVARPRRRRGPLPAVAYIYGGGWRNGNPDQGLPAVVALAFRGFFAATIDYRSSNEATFPAQLEDCKAGIRYLQSHATVFGLDPARIGIIGLSSGGHLGALLGTGADPGSARENENEQQRADVAVVVDWSGPVDLLAMAEEQGTAAAPDTNMARLLGGPVAANTELAAKANPIAYLRNTAPPPFLIVHGATDRVVPLNQSLKLHEALTRAGGRSELLVLRRKGHGFLGIQASLKTLSSLERELKRSSQRRI
jgi:acetyl esterase/lipase